MPNNFITLTNASGKAAFTDKVPPERLDVPLFPGGSLDLGSLQCIYYTSTFKPDVSTDLGIAEYAQVRENGLPPGDYAPPNGTIINILTLGPNFEGPWHKTATLDVLAVIEGAVEIHLDGGDSRTLHVGDSIVQNATNHRWKNVTPNGGVVRLFAVSQPVVAWNHGLWAQRKLN